MWPPISGVPASTGVMPFYSCDFILRMRPQISGASKRSWMSLVRIIQLQTSYVASGFQCIWKVLNDAFFSLLTSNFICGLRFLVHLKVVQTSYFQSIDFKSHTWHQVSRAPQILHCQMIWSCWLDWIWYCDNGQWTWDEVSLEIGIVAIGLEDFQHSNNDKWISSWSCIMLESASKKYWQWLLSIWPAHL